MLVLLSWCLFYVSRIPKSIMEFDESHYRVRYIAAMKDLEEMSQVVLTSREKFDWVNVLQYHIWFVELLRIKASYDSYRRAVEEKFPSLLEEEIKRNPSFLKSYFAIQGMCDIHSPNGWCEPCERDYTSSGQTIASPESFTLK